MDPIQQKERPYRHAEQKKPPKALSEYRCGKRAKEKQDEGPKGNRVSLSYQVEVKPIMLY
jgi:hypothetical protein